jgi:hypothetical protein
MSEEFTTDQREAIEKIQKLLNLAAKNPSKEEAASAAAKAQELLAKYNLDTSVIERESGVDGKRADEKLQGGIYKHQRDLWAAVARLNFCFYWTQEVWEERMIRKTKVPIMRFGRTFKHRLVGRKVNIAATVAMAGYLEQAIGRICLERCQAGKIEYNSNWAASYRKGCAQAVIDKLDERRDALLEEEAKKAAQARRASNYDGRVSTATGLTVSSYTATEQEANYDFLNGEGAWARRLAARAQAAKEREEEERRYTAWAKEHPDEARAQEEEARKSRRSGGRVSYGRTSKDNIDRSAFFTGVDEAKAKISLDPQVDISKRARIS